MMIKPFRAAFAALVLTTLFGAAQAGHFEDVSPSYSFTRWESNGPDWVLVFRLPRNASFSSVRPQNWRTSILWQYASSMGGLDTYSCPGEVTLTAGTRARLYSYGIVPTLRDFSSGMKVRVWVP